MVTKSIRNTEVGKMIQYVVWMDSERAQLFNMKLSGIEKSHVKLQGANQIIGSAKKFFKPESVAK